MGEGTRWEKGYKSLSADKKFLRVLHVSDLHVDGRYMVGGEANCNFGETIECCRRNRYNSTLYHKALVNGTVPREQIGKPAGYWGELKCDTPWALLGSAVDAIRNVGGKEGYDLGLFTGDQTVHDDLFRYSHDLVKYSEEAVSDILKYALDDAPLMATPGNHDSSPENTFAPHNLPAGRGQQHSWDAEHVSSLWRSKGWIDNEAAQDARKH